MDHLSITWQGEKLSNCLCPHRHPLCALPPRRCHFICRIPWPRSRSRCPSRLQPRLFGHLQPIERSDKARVTYGFKYSSVRRATSSAECTGGTACSRYARLSLLRQFSQHFSWRTRAALRSPFDFRFELQLRVHMLLLRRDGASPFLSTLPYPAVNTHLHFTH